ncbi:MAG: hypothetical protein HC853_14705 [Anaerolineae bacterium]|nr:hypothetical protein [Anaerolineae bacterium]
MIHFDRDVCGDFAAATQREWLETNGLGGFAASTIVGTNTRRYHGLLVAATQPPVGRIVLLSILEETLVLLDGDGTTQRYELSANQYPDVVHPHGHRYLTGFRLDPFPIFTYEVEGIIIEKSVFMVHGENTVCVQYTVRDKPEFSENPSLSSTGLLEVRPLIAFRDFHATTHANEALNANVDVQTHRATVQPYTGLPALHIGHDADTIDTTSFWYRNFEYVVERERGLDFREDLFRPICTHI